MQDIVLYDISQGRFQQDDTGAIHHTVTLVSSISVYATRSDISRSYKVMMSRNGRQACSRPVLTFKNLNSQQSYAVCACRISKASTCALKNIATALKSHDLLVFETRCIYYIW